MGYSKMLMDSAEIIYDMLKHPNKFTIEDKKITIAAANTLAMTAKTALQNEVITMKLRANHVNTNQLVHTILDETKCLEG
jgi:hypothetical protein